MKIQDIIKVAEQKGWKTFIKEDDKGMVNIEFYQFSPYGQDFGFSVSGHKNKPEMLIEAMDSYYKSFDVDYEAYLWIGEDGHGKRGAPYHIKDIVKDMEAVEEMIYQLLVTLEHERTIR
ncbi:MAG: hypothetical protein PUK67_05185 [Prevotellaceae bacterium]|nr:hypothetical protein [Prevotellaceae bacterium]MDY3365800.1 hypothetical protein [Prevotella sp.]